jgi:uncharacterized membrane protein
MLFRKHFFSTAEKKQIIDAIVAAEKHTSGQIKVHVEPHCKGDVLSRAAHVFHKLKMQKTAMRNAVLIYLAHDDKRFAIVGDKGINDAVPSDFWDSTRNTMSVHFKNGQFVSGVVHGINESAKQLSTYFPHQANDKKEISHDISEG